MSIKRLIARRCLLGAVAIIALFLSLPTGARAQDGSPPDHIIVGIPPAGVPMQQHATWPMP